MPRIRVGIIGLSGDAKTSWAAKAHLPYFRSSQNKYDLTAICNSSVDKAKAAVKAFELPITTKVYGNPSDLADDGDIDLVVCVTRVDVHYATIRPSLLKGKQVYCEWPLAQDVEAVTELATIAKEKGLRTVVGLQGHLSPAVLAMKSLIEMGRIGKVLSSTVLISGGSRTRDILPDGLQYFAQKKVGGNPITIGFGHVIDFVLDVLGELSSFRSQLSLQRPEVGIVESDGRVSKTVISDVPDHLLLQGRLLSHADAPLSVNFRRGQPFKDTPGLIWYVCGEHGEIRLSSAAASLQANDEDFSIELHDFRADTLENVHAERQFTDLPIPARNVASTYEAFANGKSSQYADFQHAMIRHRMIAEVFRSSDKDERAVYLDT